jgi:hypothetical protein
MTDEELVERLLDFDKVTVGDARDAADRIEALTAKVKLMDDLDVINGEKIEALTAKLAEAEAKLAKAVEALGIIKDRQFYRMGPGITAQVIARTTLAEIEGEKT